MPTALNCARLTAFYSVFGRDARMVFTVDVGLYPVGPSLVGLADTFIDWDVVGGIHDLPFQAERSEHSVLRKVEVISIDPRDIGMLYRPLELVDGLSYSGHILDRDSTMLPSGCAPCVYWRTNLTPGQRRGRTYLPGITAAAAAGTDLGTVSDEARATFADMCGDLLSAFTTEADSQMVLLRHTIGGHKVELSPSYPILGVRGVGASMRTQVRRMVPQRGGH
jgi:hypothetical protein